MKLTLKNASIIFCLLFSLNILANNLNGIKIFINPGHGGYDGNDRNVPATGFWESEANLTKGLYLDTLLRKLGATTQITRTTNTSDDDLAGSAIKELSNSSNSDVFLSIHSNGFIGTTNYALTLFNGYDDAPVIPEAKTFAIEVWQQLLNKGFVWAHTFQNARGDLSFNAGWTKGYTILYGNTVPAIISEGSFHDYIPESWRLKSEKYCHSESHAFVRAILTYFNKPGLIKGSIVGLIRDKSKTVSYYSVPNSNDLFEPINNAKATLLPNNIVQYTDTLNNGFVFFEDLNPGNYQIIIEADNYITDTVNAVVVANESTKFEKFIEVGTNPPPTHVNTITSNNNIIISPNPTTNNLTISNLSSNSEIKIYDLTGNLVFSRLNVTENKTNINISTLSKGIYILKIKFKDRELIKKIMKQ